MTKKIKRKTINHFDSILGNKTNLFDDTINDKGSEKNLEKGNKSDSLKEADDTTEKKITKSNPIIKSNIEVVSLESMVSKRNEIVKDKSINQVHINDVSKEILDRLKRISKFSITSITDALIINYYINNKEQIDKDLKKITNNSIF